MCIFEYNEEKALQYIKEDEYDKGKKVGECLGRAEGERLAKIDVIANMLGKNMSDEEICELAGCDWDMVEDVRKNMLVTK